MSYSPYIGHPAQLCSVEEVRLQGGRGDGMRLLQVRNAAGLEFVVSEDRCADIARLTFKGDNLSFMSSCGFVAPAYYDMQGAGFLKSFTAGFLTTCGLSAVGSPCRDADEDVPMHGTVANTPADRVWWEETENEILIHAVVRDAVIFGRKLVLERTITCGKNSNKLKVNDRITNEGDLDSPLMVLYHMNMGYPLLCEDTVLEINSTYVRPRDARAAEGIDSWNSMQPPTPGFAEQCYYHTFSDLASVKVFNPRIGKGLELSFDAGVLDHFIEWKMMGVHDYVLGLEPANCYVDGRDKIRENGELKFIQPGESVSYSFEISFFEK